MIDLTRVAFVACGSLRTFSNCYKSWNMFKEQHNYVFTWDTDYIKPSVNTAGHSNISIETIPSLTKVEDLIEAKKQNAIIDYTVFKEPVGIKATEKSPFLWSILDNYISYDYDYILITRPDLFTQLNSNEQIKNYTPPTDNEVHVTFIDHKETMMSDDIFFMKRTTYKKFSEVFSYLYSMRSVNVNPGSIHHILYKFFEENNISITDMIGTHISSTFCRAHTTINQTSEIQILQENFRMMDTFTYTKVPNVAIILIVTSTILTNKDKEIFYNLGIKRQRNKHGDGNYGRRLFESSTLELGLEKIEHYKKVYNVEIFDIEVVDVMTDGIANI